MIYIVSYDLNKQGQRYKELIDAINKLGYDRLHPEESFWLIATDKLNADSILKQLKPFLDSNDRMFISKAVASDRAGWLTENQWNWVNKNI